MQSTSSKLIESLDAFTDMGIDSKKIFTRWPKHEPQRPDTTG